MWANNDDYNHYHCADYYNYTWTNYYDDNHYNHNYHDHYDNVNEVNFDLGVNFESI